MFKSIEEVSGTAMPSIDDCDAFLEDPIPWLYCDEVPVDKEVVDPVLADEYEKVLGVESALKFELFFFITLRNLLSPVDKLSFSTSAGIFSVNLEGSVAVVGLYCSFVTAVIVRSMGTMGLGSAEGWRPSLRVYIEVSISCKFESALADLVITDRPNDAFGAARPRPADICRGVVPADVDLSLFGKGMGRSPGECADGRSPTDPFRNLTLVVLLAIVQII